MGTVKDMRGRPSINKTEHLVPHANRLLAGAAKAAWVGFRFLAHVAVRIPGWFLRANRRHVEGSRDRKARRDNQR